MCETFVFLGASTLFGIDVIKSRLLDIGIETQYFENERLFSQIAPKESKNVVLSNEIPNVPHAQYICVNEYWVTKLKDANIKNAPRKALNASRSKYYLSQILATNGIECPASYTPDEAAQMLNAGTGKLLLKPDSLCSSHGVHILTKNNIARYDEYAKEIAETQKSKEDIFGVHECTSHIWDYVDGEEYSADVFVYRGKSAIVRLCRKTIVFPSDRPVCTVTELSTPTSEVEAHIAKWTQVLYGADDVSFAQFDFIVQKGTGKIFLVDFSARIGGGMQVLFGSLPSNIYADAIINALTGKQSDFSSMLGHRQCNDIPVGMAMSIVRDFEFTYSVLCEEDKYRAFKAAIPISDSYETLKRCYLDDNSPLYEWVPTVILQAYGLDVYKTFELTPQCDKTIILANPLFKDCDDYIKDIEAMNVYEIERHEYTFTTALAAHIYGGTPWFRACYRAYKKEGVFGKTGYAYTVTRRDGREGLNALISFKNDWREKHREMIKKIPFTDEAFSGIINPFHIPNPIENSRHMKSIEACYV